MQIFESLDFKSFLGDVSNTYGSKQIYLKATNTK